MSTLQELLDERDETRAAIREGVRAVVSRFDADYWYDRDQDGNRNDPCPTIRPSRSSHVSAEFNRQP